jgi:hypothetical protein
MKALLAALFFGAIGVFFVWFMGPSVWKDFNTDEGKLVPALEYRVTEASCKSRVFVVTTCDVELTHMTTNESVDFDYLIFGRMGGETVYGLQTADGKTLTTNTGMDNLTNRIISLIAFIILVFGLAFAGIKAMFRGDDTGQTYGR